MSAPDQPFSFQDIDRSENCGQLFSLSRSLGLSVHCLGLRICSRLLLKDSEYVVGQHKLDSGLQVHLFFSCCQESFMKISSLLTKVRCGIVLAGRSYFCNLCSLFLLILHHGSGRAGLFSIFCVYYEVLCTCFTQLFVMVACLLFPVSCWPSRCVTACLPRCIAGCQAVSHRWVLACSLACLHVCSCGCVFVFVFCVMLCVWRGCMLACVFMRVIWGGVRASLLVCVGSVCSSSFGNDSASCETGHHDIRYSYTPPPPPTCV